MVEQEYRLDSLFHALADSTRRDILARVARKESSISELAKPYALTFAAIAKHVSVLERASLVRKERRGKEQVIYLSPSAVEVAEEHIARYMRTWNERFNKLDQLLLDKPEDKHR